MAAGFLNHLAGHRIEVRSAGSIPGDQVNPAAIEAMKEVGVDIADAKPKILTAEAVQTSDYVIAMGCGDACPIFPGKKYLDWTLEDLAGKGVESVRPIRDEIKTRIEALIAEIDAEQEPDVLDGHRHTRGHRRRIWSHWIHRCPLHCPRRAQAARLRRRDLRRWLADYDHRSRERPATSAPASNRPYPKPRSGARWAPSPPDVGALSGVQASAETASQRE